MTGIPVLDTILFLASVFFSTLISISEYAIDAVSRSRLETLAEEGNRNARRCLELKQHSEDVQAAVRISNTFLLLFAAALVSPPVTAWVWELSRSLGLEWMTGGLRVLTQLTSTVLIASVFVVFGVLVAKSIGTHFAEPLTLRSVGMMHFLTRFFRVPKRVLVFFADLFLRPIGHTSRFSESPMSEEGLMSILEEGTKSGILDQTEHDLIESIFQFTETTAREIMIPRTDMVAIEYSMTPGKIFDTVLLMGFTRMPVYKESLDNIVGVIYAKDVISLIEHPNLIILDDLLRPAFFVPETKQISELLREFQRKRIHLAVVVDEFGGTAGIITLEDLLEVIVGDIRDEYDEEHPLYELFADGTVEADGILNISDFNDATEFSIPESDDYDTVGGFVTSLIGRIPVAGDRCGHGQLDVEVLDVDERRVKRVRVSRRPPENGEIASS